ncbi:hypothetical protein SAMN05216251_107148 [Actinacidiphila alni]|uniref:DUF8094 domain-containing protein n=1 Tax=Actinacidiphila alni TaxID=380248 RepID=A0A1I2F3G1_9ACTN|nr:hypothetical protein [Actinacidiphila alni]SFE99912.1 hypothetical protein SAMN05216251_107148 [Actinacidiphila alni]
MNRRGFCLAAAATALAVPLTGCVTVHGERADIPAVRSDGAAQVLARFARASNAATRAYDESLIDATESGALGDTDRAGLRAKHANHPEGNPEFTPLVFSDTRFLVPRQRGWPKFFVADTATNRGADRWLLVFRRFAAGDPWKASFLAVLPADALPAPATDKDGHVLPLPLSGTDLLVQPGRLSAAYSSYLQQAADAPPFADGPSTSQQLAGRDKNRRTANSVTQYADQPADGGDFTPVALRTKDGGALVFFAGRHQTRATYREGYRLTIDQDTQALMTGTPRTSVTLSRLGQQAVTVPPADAPGAKVTVLSRLAGLVAATGA